MSKKYEFNYLNYYNKDKAIPIIVDALQKEGFDINIDCIKFWAQPRMRYDDVLRGVNYVRSINKNIIVYTNKVMFKDRLSKDLDITILDVNDIEDIFTKQKRLWQIYDCF